MDKLQNPIQIIGIELRTTNDLGRSFVDIPLFWQRFLKKNCATHIQNKLNNDLYAVYTRFENEGKNNQGMYSLIIGCPVKSNTTAATGFTTIAIPAGSYLVLLLL